MLRLCSQTSFTSIYSDYCDTRTYDDDDSYDGDGVCVYGVSRPNLQA